MFFALGAFGVRMGAIFNASRCSTRKAQRHNIYLSPTSIIMPRDINDRIGEAAEQGTGRKRCWPITAPEPPKAQ